MPREAIETTASIAESTTSKQVEPDLELDQELPTRFDYSWVAWQLLCGFHKPIVTKTRPMQLNSWVWDFGIPIEDSDTNLRHFLCQTCHLSHKDGRLAQGRRSLYAYPVEHGTSGVQKHLLRFHKNILNKRSAPNEAIESPLAKRLKLDANVPEHQELLNIIADEFDPHLFRQHLIRWVVYDNISFHKLEGSRFRSLLVYLNGRCEEHLPKHQTIREWIMEEYKHHKRTVIQALQNARSKIHICFDLWTSRNLLALNGIVAHFLGADYQPRTLLLALPEQKDAHTGDNIASHVARIIEEFKIEGNLGYFVLDNATNNNTCMEALGKRYNFKVPYRRLRCAGHVINLIARALLFGQDPDSFEADATVVKSLNEELGLWRQKGPIGKLHNIVTWIYRSSQRHDRFMKIQEDIHQRDGIQDYTLYELIQDNKTRWNSTKLMIERAINLRRAVEQFLDVEKASYSRNPSSSQDREDNIAATTILDDCMTGQDWDILLHYKELLAPLHIVTNDLESRPEGSKHGSISYVLSGLEWILECLEDAKVRYSSHPEHHFRHNINLAWQKADEYYQLLDESPAYLASVVLHPRFKWQWINRSWHSKKAWRERGQDEMKQLWKDYECMPIGQAVDKVASITTSGLELSGLEAYRARFQAKKRSLTPPLDLDSYDAWTKLEPEDDCEDPIAYWVAESSRRPRLAKMALDILTIPAMSSEPERIFSLAGIMATDRRSKLKADTIEACQCLKSWDHYNVISISSEREVTDNMVPNVLKTSQQSVPEEDFIVYHSSD